MKLTEGINQDTALVDQPQGTWRTARNIVVDVPGSITNEEGFSLLDLDSYPDDKIIIGTINLPDDIFVLFLVDRTTGNTRSELGILEKGVYTTVLARQSVLRFDSAYPVSGVYIYNSEGELIIGFTDNYNAPKVMNVKDRKSLISVTDEDLIKMFPNISVPLIKLHDVIGGGSLAAGVYYFSFAYELQDGSTTNWMPLSNPVTIHDHSVRDSYGSIDGAEPGTPCGKTIILNLTSVDARYQKIKMAVVKRIGGQVSAEDVSSFVIKEPSMIVSYSGDEVTTDLLIEEITADTALYDTVKNMHLLNDRLYLGNLAETNVLDYQAYAANIRVGWTAESSIPMESGNGSYKDPYVIYNKRTFMPGEVYAFYIRFILKNGATSPAFHIPGRPVDQYWDPNSGQSGEYKTATIASSAWTAAKVSSERDLLKKTIGVDEYNMTEYTTINSRSRYFHWYDTTFLASGGVKYGACGYWENLDESYVGLEYDGTSVDPINGRNLLAEGEGHVLHHKFPSRKALAVHGITTVDDVNQSGAFISETFQVGTEVFNAWNDFQYTPTGFDQVQTYIIHENNTGDNLTTTLFTLDGLIEMVSGGCGADPLDGLGWEVRFMFYIGDSSYDRAPAWDDMEIAQAGQPHPADPDSYILQAGYLRYDSEQPPTGMQVFLDFDPGGTTHTYEAGQQIIFAWATSNQYDLPVEIANLCSGAGAGGDEGDSATSTNLQVLLSATITAEGEGLDVGEGTGSLYTPILGASFSNIVIPEEIRNKIQGFEILYAERSISNTLKLGESVIYDGQRSDWLGTNYESAPNTNYTTIAVDEWARLHPFDMLTFKPNNKPTHIEFLMESSNSNITGTDQWDVSEGTTLNDPYEHGWRYNLGYLDNKAAGEEPIKSINIRVSEVQYVPANNGQAVIDNRFGQEFLYAKLTQSIVLKDSANHRQYIVGVMTFKSNVYNSFLEQPLVSTGFIQKIEDGSGDITANIPSVFGGDSFVTKQYDFLTRPSKNVINHNNISDISLTSYYGSNADEGSIRNYGYPTYTALNGNLRYENPLEWWDTFYPKYDKPLTTRIPEGTAFGNWNGSATEANNLQGSTTMDTENQQHEVMVNAANINYNSDYSSLNNLEGSFIPYDPANNYTLLFPNSVARSVKASRVNPIADIRKFLSQDIYEMPKDKGQIWNLASIGDVLLIHHEYALYRTVGKEVLQTGITEVTIGSGDIFEREPKEIIPSGSAGYAGTYSQYAAFTCKLGYFFVDQKQGRVFLFNDKLNEISSEGMRIFFRDRLPLSVDDDNPYAGAGIMAAYDNKYNRIIISKKDPTDTWTVSYSGNNNAWASFHDYNPDALFSSTSLISSYGEQVYEHNTDKYVKCIFYGSVIYPSSIDTIFIGSPDTGINTVFTNIYWEADLIDPNGVYLRSNPLTAALMYNNYQCSGEVDLELDTYMAGNIRNVHNVWKFNKFRDIAIRGMTFFDDDLVLNTNALDDTRPWYDRKRFMDQFLGVRLIYDNNPVDGVQNNLYLYSVGADQQQIVR